MKFAAPDIWHPKGNAMWKIMILAATVAMLAAPAAFAQATNQPSTGQAPRGRSTKQRRRSSRAARWQIRSGGEPIRNSATRAEDLAGPERSPGTAGNQIGSYRSTAQIRTAAVIFSSLPEMMPG